MGACLQRAWPPDGLVLVPGVLMSRSIHALVLILLFFGGMLTASGAWACRCSPQTLAHYFELADVVAEAEVLRVEPAIDTGQIEVSFRSLQTFKGNLDRPLLTHRDGSVCGLVFAVGTRWWVFAQRPTGASILRANSCNGTRLVGSPFLETPESEVGAHLRHLSMTRAPQYRPFVPVKCWHAARRFHAAASDEMRSKLSIERRAREPALTRLVPSPNGAYRFWLLPMRAAPRPPHVVNVLIDTERDYLLDIQVHGLRHATDILPRWVNEKLLQIHLRWGVEEAADALFDVESEQFLYLESVHDGKALFAEIAPTPPDPSAACSE